MYVRTYVLQVMIQVVDKGLEGKGRGRGKDGRKAKAKERLEGWKRGKGEEAKGEGERI